MTAKHSFFVYFMIFFCSLLQGQKHDAWWPVGVFQNQSGYGTGLIRFDADTMSFVPIDLQMNFEASVAVASDSSGQLLFYSNGCEIRNSDNELLLNGSDLNPGPLHDWVCANGYVMARSMAAIPLPGDKYKWILLHLGGRYEPYRKLIYEKLYYSLIDMSAQNGRGEVLQKNILLASGDFDPFSIVRHGNGRDWWLVLPEYNSNQYQKWIIDPTGLMQTISQSIGQVFDCRYNGSSVFSKDGTLFARTQHCKATVLHYNRCSGDFSFLTDLERPGESLGGGGLAFSENNRWLYATSNVCMFRADLKADSIYLDSLYKRPYYEGTSQYVYSTSLTHMQPMPNGVYAMSSRHQDKYFSTFAIENDTFAFAAKGLVLPINIVRTLPYFPNYQLYDFPNTICDSLGINSTPVIDISSNDLVHFFPNPFAQVLNIDLSAKSAELRIFNVLGQYQFSSHLGNGQNQIGTASLPSGIYLLDIILATGERFQAKAFKDH